MRLMVVTGGDETYAPFVTDLAASLVRAKAKFPVALGCLDYGLTEPTRARLGQTFDQVVKPDWPFRPQPQFDQQIQARAFASRPFLPDYFPGYDAYAWIDADSFVQDQRALALLAAACSNGNAGVVPTVDRSYQHTRETIDWVLERYRMAFGPETARRMLTSGPYVASGVVAAAAVSPLWKMWQTRFQEALDRWDGPRLCDQAVLNHVVYIDRLPHHKLPSTCNWVSHLAKPLIDVQRGAVVEPSYPFAPLLIIANSFNEKGKVRKFPRLGGGTVETTLTYEGIRNVILAARNQARS